MAPGIDGFLVIAKIDMVEAEHQLRRMCPAAALSMWVLSDLALEGTPSVEDTTVIAVDQTAPAELPPGRDSSNQTLTWGGGTSTFTARCMRDIFG
jgi:hypothetical protein